MGGQVKAGSGFRGWLKAGVGCLVSGRVEGRSPTPCPQVEESGWGSGDQDGGRVTGIGGIWNQGQGQDMGNQGQGWGQAVVEDWPG